MTAEIAPHTDRLVWAVADRLREQHSRGELPELAILSGVPFSRTINLVQFMYPDIGVDFIRRRYIYASEEQIAEFVDALVGGGFVEMVGERLAPAEPLPDLLSAFDRAIADSARMHWVGHIEVLESVLPLARQVLEACPNPGPLVAAALSAPEAQDGCQLLYQRLAALRLLRNEAHVRAWKSRGLSPVEIELLTSAWAGSKIQTASDPTAAMVERGLAEHGVITEAGLDLRRTIEDETNAGVSDAFAAIDCDELLSGLRALPGPLS